MKLIGKLLALIVLFPKFINSFFRRVRSEFHTRKHKIGKLFASIAKRIPSELYSFRRQLPYLFLYGWPKYILAASKPDADACASPMAFLLAKKLRVNQVWWRQIQAGEEHIPRGFEHFIPVVHFDVGGKFDGKVVDGKVVKPGKLFFDHHHHDPSLKDHCATSLVIGSFGLKDHVLNFLGEYVRLIDTGHPGEATAFLKASERHGETLVQRYSAEKSRFLHPIMHINNLHRFFGMYPKREAFQLIESNAVGRALSALEQLFGTLPTTRYIAEREALALCRQFYNAIIGIDWAYTKAAFSPAKQACEKLVAKLADQDPSTEQDLHLAVYGIGQSNAKILGAISPLVNGLKKDISRSEQLRNGCLAFQSFYNQESLRHKILREMLPGGTFKEIKIKNSGGQAVRVLAADNVPYDGTAMRITIRNDFYDSVDLIVCGSASGQIGLILVDPIRRAVLPLRRFLDVLVQRYPAQKSSFLHPMEFLLYVNKKVAEKDKISFADIFALARELIESTPVASKPTVTIQSTAAATVPVSL